MSEKKNPPKDDSSAPFESAETILGNRLWAPWRMQYIQGAAEAPDSGCIFCDKPKSPDDQSELILRRGDFCFVMMNLYPYNNGHLMIAPYRHLAEIDQLNQDEIIEGYELLRHCIAALKETMHPHGYNVGLNMGRVAGAGIENHLHLHLVPRWNGDTNFMPVIAETKVISESLQESWRRLKQALEGIK